MTKHAKPTKRTELYERALDFYRQHPGDYSECGRQLGITYNTASRYWNIGYLRLNLDPIKDVIEREKHLSRARVAQLEQQVKETEQEVEERILAQASNNETFEREKARNDAIKARAAEGLLVRYARDNVIQLLESSKAQLTAFNESREILIKKIKFEMQDMSAKECADLMWRIAISSRAATESGMKALQMERLLLGQPMEIIGVKNQDDLTEEQAIERLGDLAEVAERARKRKERRDRKLRLVANE